MYPAQPGNPGEMYWTTKPGPNGRPTSRETIELISYWHGLSATQRASLCSALRLDNPKVWAEVKPDGELVVSGRPSRVLYALRHSPVVTGLPICRPRYT